MYSVLILVTTSQAQGVLALSSTKAYPPSLSSQSGIRLTLRRAHAAISSGSSGSTTSSTLLDVAGLSFDHRPKVSAARERKGGRKECCTSFQVSLRILMCKILCDAQAGAKCCVHKIFSPCACVHMLESILLKVLKDLLCGVVHEENALPRTSSFSRKLSTWSLFSCNDSFASVAVLPHQSHDDNPIVWACLICLDHKY